MQSSYSRAKIYIGRIRLLQMKNYWLNIEYCYYHHCFLETECRKLSYLNATTYCNPLSIQIKFMKTVIQTHILWLYLIATPTAFSTVCDENIYLICSEFWPVFLMCTRREFGNLCHGTAPDSLRLHYRFTSLDWYCHQSSVQSCTNRGHCSNWVKLSPTLTNQRINCGAIWGHACSMSAKMIKETANRQDICRTGE